VRALRDTSQCHVTGHTTTRRLTYSDKLSSSRLDRNVTRDELTWPVGTLPLPGNTNKLRSSRSPSLAVAAAEAINDDTITQGVDQTPATHAHTALGEREDA